MLIKAEFTLDNGPGDIATGATTLNARTPASINWSVTLASNTTALNMLMNGVVVYGVGEEAVTVPWALMTQHNSFGKILGVEKTSGGVGKQAAIISRSSFAASTRAYICNSTCLVFQFPKIVKRGV